MTTHCTHDPLCHRWGDHQEKLGVPVDEDFAAEPICECGYMGWACVCWVTVQSPTGPQTADRGTSSIWTVEIAVDNVMPHMVNVIIKGENGVTVEWMIDSSIEILAVQ